MADVSGFLFALGLIALTVYFVYRMNQEPK